MEPLLQLLIQIPLVGAFMWFVLKQQERDGTERTARDSAWREFLTDQRSATVAAMSDISNQLQRVANKLDAHDNLLRDVMQDIRDVGGGSN